MLSSEFYQYATATTQEAIDLLKQKESEYADGKDRLCQFKQIAAFTGQTSEQVLLGMWIKHVQSLIQYINEDAEAPRDSYRPLSKWDEKILDCINYLLLLRALRTELEDSLKPFSE